MSIPSPSQENDEHRELINLSELYSNYLWTRISNLPFFAKISKFCLQFGRARSRRQKLCLPLPLPSKSVDSSMILTEASRIYDVLDDIFEHILLNMHNVQKNLQYWQDKAEGSNVQKAHFMLFERGPQALIGETVEFLRNFITKDSSFQILCRSASGFISERVAVLDSLRTALAAFLAQVYMVINKQGEDLLADPQKSLPSLLVTINGLFSDLEISISQLHVSSSQVDCAGDSNSSTLIFNKMTEAQREQSQWTDDQIRNAIDIINQNLQKLESYLSVLVARYQKPRKVTRYWVRYTCGAVGLSVCSLWIVRHSRLVGSPDIDNWIRGAKDSTITFWTEHVEQPMLSIRDELFETFRKRHRGVMEAEEVQLTANSLHRMLVAFCEQTNGQKFPENVTDQELLELVMGRYEKEMMHPLKNTFSGELPRAMLIQVQKLKLDIETAMLELNQILRANEINFAILAALPAFVVVVFSLMLVRSRIMQDKGAEGRGRLARRQRRLLIVEIEKRIMHYQSCMDLGQTGTIQTGGFGYDVYAGRRDGRVSKDTEATMNLPPPFVHVQLLTKIFSSKGLTQEEMVILSGAHTIGRAHCTSFSYTLYSFNTTNAQDPTIHPAYAAQLLRQCPSGNAGANIVVPMDPISPTVSDTAYYRNILVNRSLSTSDQTLISDATTAVLVIRYARDPVFWGRKFADAMVAMGQVGVLTGVLY